MKILRLFADEAGESHFEEVEIPSTTLRHGSSQSLSLIADSLPVTAMTLRDVLEEGPLPSVWHPNPSRRFEFFLKGHAEIETSDGEVRHMAPGDFLFGEDTFGKGHLFRPLEGQRWTMFLEVPEGWQLPVT